MGGRETLHFLCNNGFMVGMLEVNTLCFFLSGFWLSCSPFLLTFLLPWLRSCLSPKGSEGPKATTLTRIAAQTPTIPVTVNTCHVPKGSEGPKATTVTRIATPIPTIPVTVDTSQNTRGSEGLKETTVRRIATRTPTIPFHCPHLAGGISC